MDKVYFKKENFSVFSNENKGYGTLKLQVYANNKAYPLEGIFIEISKIINNNKVIFFEGFTNNSGIIDQIILPAKEMNEKIESKEDIVYTTYTLVATYNKYNLTKVYEIKIFDKVKVIQHIKFPFVLGGIYE